MFWGVLPLPRFEAGLIPVFVNLSVSGTQFLIDVGMIKY